MDLHRSTSVLLSRPKNMSEEMAFALANFCLASLDSDTAAGTSAFLLLGSLGRNPGDGFLISNIQNHKPTQSCELRGTVTSLQLVECWRW